MHTTTEMASRPMYYRRRRSSRHRMLCMALYMCLYCAISAVMSSSVTNLDSASVPDSVTIPEPVAGPPRDLADVAEITAPVQPPDTKKVINEITKQKETNGGPDTEKGAKVGGKKAMKGLEDDEGAKKKQKDAGYSDDEPMIEEREEEELEENAIPTVHPLRNCTPPAIEQFPKPLMGQWARSHGGLIIHILVAMYTFIGLAIVCDDYFVSSLDRICEELKLTPDVAGATFMAAGSSAPELATVVIGVFCAQDDIGVSGVIGSAVFNIMFVISVCALFAGTVSHLNWWPLCRDCFFYALSIFIMLCVIANGYISWPEALIMMLTYVVYCVALANDARLERWALSLPLPVQLPARHEQSALLNKNAAAAPAGDKNYTEVEGKNNVAPLQTNYNPDATYDNAAYNAEPPQTWDPNSTWDPASAWGDQSGNQQTAPQPGGGNDGWDTSWGGPTPAAPAAPAAPAQDPEQALSPVSIPVPEQPKAPAYYKAKEYNPETAVNPLLKPIGANPFQMCWWYIGYPIHFTCKYSMPDVHGRLYPLTFLVSMLWISFYSYFMVWMITIIGFTLGVPDTVMGLTFVAAGVSVPDALSSLAVIKEGYGDMAVSNAVGSNVFDILVCLGLPWFLQTAIVHPGSHVNVISKGLIYSTLSLFSTVIFLVVATHANGWKLDRKFGAVLMVWYILFITFASLYELNIFGDFHPPDCGSPY